MLIFIFHFADPTLGESYDIENNTQRNNTFTGIEDKPLK